MFQIIDLKKLLFFYIDNVLKNRTFDQISDSENELFAAKTQHQFSEDQSEVYPKKSRLSQLLSFSCTCAKKTFQRMTK